VENALRANRLRSDRKIEITRQTYIYIYTSKSKEVVGILTEAEECIILTKERAESSP
jgi:hypothetical protein